MLKNEFPRLKFHHKCFCMAKQQSWKFRKNRSSERFFFSGFVFRRLKNLQAWFWLIFINVDKCLDLTILIYSLKEAHQLVLTKKITFSVKRVCGVSGQMKKVRGVRCKQPFENWMKVSGSKSQVSSAWLKIDLKIFCNRSKLNFWLISFFSQNCHH